MTRKRGIIEEIFKMRVNEHPLTTWLKFKDEKYSWADRVAIMMGNSPEFLWAYFGISFYGATPVPINTSQRGVTLSHIIRDSGACLAFVDGAVAEVVAHEMDNSSLKHLIVKDGSFSHKNSISYEKIGNYSDQEPSTGDENASGLGMMYTSGTTGPPKGVVTVRSEANVLGPILGALNVNKGETMYTCLPLFHGNALFITTIGTILLDASLGLGERFSASRIWDDLRKFEAVEFNTLGGMISILLKKPESDSDKEHKVRTVLSAGCPADKWQEFEKRFGVKIVEFYGMIDSPGILLNAEGKIGSMGKPVSGCEFAVVDGKDNPLPAGQVGELCFRTPAGQATYYNNNEEATKSAYRNGWFHSGDLAEYDSEGYFYYRGRKKESIRRLGENISAWEIETVANGHPDILESAAHAIPSELGEDEVKLCCVLRPGSTLNEGDVISYLEGKIASYALPRYIEFVDELPKTPTHRVQYHILKARGLTEKTWDRLSQGAVKGS
jgi:crotonobetaine/carnitine-CoA ligase